MQPLPQPGDSLEIHYPVSTHLIHAGTAISRRELTVRSVRDLIHEPLTVEEFLRRPYVRRGRYLIHAMEPIGMKARHRKFYLANSPEFAAPNDLLLFSDGKLIDTCPPDPVSIRRFIREIQKLARTDHKLAIAAADIGTP